MNKVLVTGLAIGKDLGTCVNCSFDLDWLFSNPSTLLWADKIIITPAIWESINDKELLKTDKAAPAVKLIFDIINSEGVLDIVNPNDIISNHYKDYIDKLVEHDSKKLLEIFPQHVKKGEEGVPNAICIDDEEYCGAYLWSIYASLFLTKHFDANCLFNNKALKYLNLKFGLDGLPTSINPNYINSFSNVFDVVIPNELTLHNYAYADDLQCNICKSLIPCKDNYLTDIEKNTYKMMSWRNYDEILQVKNITQRIINAKNSYDGILDPAIIKNEFSNEKMKINKRIKRIFPKIKRWTSMSTIISIPITLGGLITGNNLLTVSGASIVGASTIVKETVNYFENKYNWLGFTNKSIENNKIEL
ncbi:MAG TPA: hypothetical protein VEB00_06355 [Clostridia bacterium]|nr:hypothetical protein [Clostridia bacterium]